MTFTEEYLPDEGQDQDDFSNYPTAFGITFTPKVSGIAFAVGGILASLYLAMQWVLPTYTEYQKLKADERSKQEQVNQGKSGELAQKYQALDAQFQEKQAQKSQVLALFANEKSLDTLLIDVSQIFKARNVELTGLQPQGDPTPINDSSLGEAVNNKLKRQSYGVQMKGGFEQTQAVIRDLERLQPLILLKGLSSQAQEGNKVAKLVFNGANNQARLIGLDNKQKTNTAFTMDVVMPLTAEELAKLAPPPEPEQQPPEEQKPEESKK